MDNASSVLGTAIAEVIQGLFGKVASGATVAAKRAWQKAFADFDPFMRETYNRNSNVRILCQKDKDISLYDIYVKSNFSCIKDKIDDDKLLFKIIEGQNIVVNGTGGAGKTFLMRHLWISLFKGDTQFTPIFLELRKINDLSHTDLLSFIRLSISPGGNIDESVFSSFCTNGRFVFFLDGFDEITREKRDVVQAQILDMASNFSKCRFVVSSRYEKRFSGWQNFELYESMPFTLKQVRELIRRLPFDENSKKMFLRNLNEEFYTANLSFLSNPLLATMMLMTFRENLDIPKKMINFYDQAFVTLYQQHDATKLYKREKSLDIIDFQRSFGIFCLLSYAKELYEFSHTEILDFIRKSNKVCGIEVSEERILSDYEESVNLIRQEGLNYVFIHRSFQEYFSAYAVISVISDKFDDLLHELKKRTSDDVLPMCYEMNKNIVINKYISKEFDDMKKRGLFSRNIGKYSALTRIKAKYELTFISDNTDGENARLYSMGIEIDPDMANFMDNINNIMSESRDKYYSYSRDTLMRPAIFSVYAGKRFKCKLSAPCQITISFQNPNGPLSVDCIESKIDKSFIDEIIAMISRNEKQFDASESELRAILRRIEAWCSAEISSSIERGRSLDEILNI